MESKPLQDEEDKNGSVKPVEPRADPGPDTDTRPAPPPRPPGEADKVSTAGPVPSQADAGPKPDARPVPPPRAPTEDGRAESTQSLNPRAEARPALSLKPLPEEGRAASQEADAQPAPPPKPVIGRLIESSTNLELAEILLQSSLELKRRIDRETSKVSTGRLPDIPISFADASVSTFVRLPAPSPTETESGVEDVWRIVLLSPNPAHPPFGVEVRGDVIIGRARGDVTPDLDLTPYEAERMGISRRHAMLRPTKDSLLLADVGSTNGTFHNSERVKLGEPKALQDNDILSFGALHLRVKIASRPAGAAEKT